MNSKKMLLISTILAAMGFAAVNTTTAYAAGIENGVKINLSATFQDSTCKILIGGQEYANGSLSVNEDTPFNIDFGTHSPSELVLDKPSYGKEATVSFNDCNALTNASIKFVGTPIGKDNQYFALSEGGENVKKQIGIAVESTGDSETILTNGMDTPVKVTDTPVFKFSLVRIADAEEGKAIESGKVAGTVTMNVTYS
ncbi:hypothetical protein RHO12_02745 [Orbus sturtevantii]|uniref:fimbrial protein n=1 Tax=Orbus sturtevantii TaxID=3074109 RepID=UPI00370D98A1